MKWFLLNFESWANKRIYKVAYRQVGVLSRNTPMGSCCTKLLGGAGRWFKYG